MFTHIFNYRIKSLLRQKSLVFWTLFFPLALATFFNIALTNIKTINDFSPIGVAVISGEALEAQPELLQTLQPLSNGEERLFNLTMCNESEAIRMLGDYEISGYIKPGNPNELVVSRMGINQSILKNFLDQYSQNTAALTAIATNDPAILPKLIEVLALPQTGIVEGSVSEKSTDPTLVYYYALIAMSCLYGSIFGIEEVNRVQANLSAQAARLNTAPVHKLKVFAAGMVAAIGIHFTGLLVLLGYMDFVLGVSFGANTMYVVMVLFVGSVLGISMGTLISAIVKKSEGLKIAVALVVSMAGSFFAGMMIAEVKYYIAVKLPILGYLNPANLLSDALYALYFYDTHMRFYLNLAGMSLYALFFCTATYLIIRGRKYANL